MDDELWTDECVGECGWLMVFVRVVMLRVVEVTS